MKSSLSINLFKLKFLKIRIISSFIKKKIKKKSEFHEFESFVKNKNFSTLWFLNNYKIIGNFLPKNYNENFKYLEIGSFEGLSSLFILSNWKNANVTCVDTWEDSKDESQILDYNFENVEKKFDLNLQKYPFTKIKSTSTEAFKMLNGKKSNYDYIYIDGSHNGLDIFNDAKASFQLLNLNGLIFFDDITNIYKGIKMQPHNAFEKFYNLYKKKIEILYLKNIAIIKKINF